MAWLEFLCLVNDQDLADFGISIPRDHVFSAVAASGCENDFLKSSCLVAARQNPFQEMPVVAPIQKIGVSPNRLEQFEEGSFDATDQVALVGLWPSVIMAAWRSNSGAGD
jgi:hypothetical protein